MQEPTSTTTFAHEIAFGQALHQLKQGVPLTTVIPWLRSQYRSIHLLEKGAPK